MQSLINYNNMTSKMKIYVISSAVLLVLLIFGLFYYNYDVLAPFFYKEKIENKSNISLSNSENIASGTEVYTNKEGKKWTVPDKAEFSVSSGNGIITFLQGEINPLKVHPGDVQNMKIVVQGVNGIDKVVAEIETDNGINKVDLKKTGVLATKDLDENLFVYNIDKNGRLDILSNKEAEAKRQIAIKSESASTSINTASAASGEQEIWEGSWIVKDTSVREYNTTFIATDSQGNQEKFVLAWSDPCLDHNNVDWAPGQTVTSTQACAISQPYGVDNGNLVLRSGGDITVKPGGKLVFNPGKGVIMPTDGHGSIIVIKTGANASMSKGYLWAEDGDGDHYPASDNRQFTTTEAPPAGSGWVRQYTLSTTTLDCYDDESGVYRSVLVYRDQDEDGYTTGAGVTDCIGETPNRGWRLTQTATDCYDTNANAHPGQTFGFPVHRGDWSFDYNCDGSLTNLGWNHYTSLTSATSGYDQICNSDKEPRAFATTTSPDTTGHLSPLKDNVNCGAYLPFSEYYNWHDVSGESWIGSCDPYPYLFYSGGAATYCY